MENVEPQRDKQIPIWMGRLETEISKAEIIKNEIFNILEPIISEPEPAKPNDEEPKQYLVPLANNLRDLVNRLSYISNAYEEILQLNEL